MHSLVAAGIAIATTTLASHTGDHAFLVLPSGIPVIGGALTLEAALFGLSTGIGIAAAVLAAAPLSLVLQPHALVDALPRALARTGAAIGTALNLIPGIARSATEIRDAQRMRGWRSRRVREWPDLAVPVVLTALEGSITLAEAMEARGYGSGVRTHYSEQVWSREDVLVAVVAAAAAVLFVGTPRERRHQRLVSVPQCDVARRQRRRRALLLCARRSASGVAAMSGTGIAVLSGFRYWYPNARVPSIDGVDLDIGSGITLIAGASGSGKSSLLRVFNGLVPHFHGGTVSGAATVCGHDVLATPTRVLATNVGFVFQDPELQSVYPSVERDVAFGLENIGTPAAVMHRRVGDALERTGIMHLSGRAVATLSGGERQRLALAGVLAMRPRMLVLDEPLSQLDDLGAQALTETIIDLAADGMAVVVAEHRFEHLGALPGRSLAVEGGRIVDAPPPTHRRISGRAIASGAGLAAAPVAWSLDDVSAGPMRDAGARERVPRWPCR